MQTLFSTWNRVEQKQEMKVPRVMRFGTHLAKSIAVALRADRFYHRRVQLDVPLDLVSIEGLLQNYKCLLQFEFQSCFHTNRKTCICNLVELKIVVEKLSKTTEIGTVHVVPTAGIRHMNTFKVY